MLLLDNVSVCECNKDKVVMRWAVMACQSDTGSHMTQDNSPISKGLTVRSMGLHYRCVTKRTCSCCACVSNNTSSLLRNLWVGNFVGGRVREESFALVSEGITWKLNPPAKAANLVVTNPHVMAPPTHQPNKFCHHNDFPRFLSTQPCLDPATLSSQY